jgi:hypothetical protein
LDLDCGVFTWFFEPFEQCGNKSSPGLSAEHIAQLRLTLESLLETQDAHGSVLDVNT